MFRTFSKQSVFRNLGRSCQTRHFNSRACSSKYDVVIIGAGPAGYAAAIRANDFGKKVAIVERSEVGGAGLFNGALSSKTMWELSQDFKSYANLHNSLKSKDDEEDVRTLELRYDAVVAQTLDAVRVKQRQMLQQLRELNIPLIKGHASFVTPKRIRVEDNGVSAEIQSDNFIIATGSSPRKHPSVVTDGCDVINSDHILGMKDFPKSMVVLGAGVVGCEFATIFTNCGKTKVYLIDKAPRILPAEDEDIAQVISNTFESKGATIHQNASLISMQAVAESGGVEYIVEGRNGLREKITVEKALLSIGREGSFQGMNLEAVGVKTTPNGVAVTNICETSVPNIYAVGDITADISLVNIGELEGRYAIEKIYGQVSPPPNMYSTKYNGFVMFLDPLLAGIGVNEAEAQKQKLNYRVAMYRHNLVARAIAKRKTSGLIKLIVTDDDDMKILGVRALGAHASSVIEVVSLMMRLNLPLKHLAELITAYPTISEALQECSRMLLGISIYKPQVFKKFARVERVTFDQNGVMSKQRIV